MTIFQSMVRHFSIVLLATMACSSDSSSNGEATSDTDSTELTVPMTFPAIDPPETKVEPVVDSYHDIAITDNYRWLEEDDSEAVTQWAKEQQAYTESMLAPYPHREEIHAQFEQLLSLGAIGTPRIKADRLFYTRRNGLENQVHLIMRTEVDGEDIELIDVNERSDDGTTALDWYYPSHDGRFIAYGLSEKGSEESVLHIYDVDAMQDLPTTIDRTRATSVGWLPDNSGFYYVRYPEPGSVPEEDLVYYRTVYFHRLGDDPANDREIFKPSEEEKTFWTSVSLSRDGRWLVLSQFDGWARSEIYLADRLGADDAFTELVAESRAMYQASVVEGQLYVLTNEEADNYKLFKADPAQPTRENWEMLVDEDPQAVLEGYSIAADAIYLNYMRSAQSQLLRFDPELGNTIEERFREMGSVSVSASPESETVFINFQSHTRPTTILKKDNATAPLQEWQALTLEGYNLEDIESQQVHYQSKDGTRISMFVIHKAGLALDGDNPTVLWGYGGFNVSLTPGFSANVMYWINQGGVYAIPNLRGGGEYGEAWHRAGMLENKQNVFDDFIAAAEYLIEENYTNSAKLAVAGGSNGGLLTGAFVTQRPELAKAALVAVPLLDMLRYHEFQIARLWIPEYGTSDEEGEFVYLYQYSPYHNVKENTAFPAVLLTTGMQDTRVDPFHARKMAALLQANNAGGGPILLRVETKGGHGAGKPTDLVIDEMVDRWTFFHLALETEYQPHSAE